MSARTGDSPQAGRGPAGAGSVLARARAAVEPALRAAVDDLTPTLRRVAGYHAGWWDADGRPRGRPGKALRPALVLACARAAGGAGHAPDGAVRAAVAVELVHNFSLLHDDVMDRDRMRRHRPTAWTIFGTAEAILTGDALLALAMDQLAASPAQARTLSAALLRLCRGQSADLAFERRADVTLAECVAMAEDKTAALLGCACELGALAGGADARTTALYAIFGRHLGLAFQVADDLLGIWGDPAATGKPVHSDLAARKKTLPVVAALTAGNPAARQLRVLYAPSTTLDEQALPEVADLVERAGGRAWAEAEADRRAAAALDALAKACPEPTAAAELRGLAGMAVRRDR